MQSSMYYAWSECVRMKITRNLNSVADWIDTKWIAYSIIHNTFWFWPKNNWTLGTHINRLFKNYSGGTNQLFVHRSLFQLRFLLFYTWLQSKFPINKYLKSRCTKYGLATVLDQQIFQPYNHGSDETKIVKKWYKILY